MDIQYRYALMHVYWAGNSVSPVQVYQALVPGTIKSLSLFGQTLDTDTVSYKILEFLCDCL
jgi:hypothetical protein